MLPHYRVVNNDRVTEIFSFAIWQLRMVRIVRNVHNDRHSARHPEASQNAYHCERCVQSELSDMCYQLKTMSLVTLSFLTTLYFPLNQWNVKPPKPPRLPPLDEIVSVGDCSRAVK